MSRTTANCPLVLAAVSLLAAPLSLSATTQQIEDKSTRQELSSRTAAGGNPEYTFLLTPSYAERDVRQSHGVFAVLSMDPPAASSEKGGSDGPAISVVSNFEVLFEVFAGPNAGLEFIYFTDGSNTAVFTYRGTTAGVDSIVATAMVDPPVVSNVVAVKWTDGIKTYALALEPETGSGEVGAEHALTATLTSESDAVAATDKDRGDAIQLAAGPEPGVLVQFDVISGPHAGESGAGLTDADGRASFSYTGVLSGTDEIVATAFVPLQQAVVSNTATFTWGTVAYSLTLEPDGGSWRLCDDFTMTATFLANDAPVVAEIVNFGVIEGGEIGEILGASETDADGKASLTYSAESIGVDSLVAFVVFVGEGGGFDGTSNVIVKEWTAPTHKDVILTLSPEVDTLLVGQYDTLTVKLTACEQPVANQEVTFEIFAGPQCPLIYTTTTDENGCAIFAWFGEEYGLDQVVVTTRLYDLIVYSNVARIKWMSIWSDWEPSLTAGDGPGERGKSGDNPFAAPTADLPLTVELGNARPNPFNPATRIPIALPEATHVSLSVYDVRGRSVATLVDRVMPAGRHSIDWRADGLASGVYFYRLVTSQRAEVKRVILLK